MSTSTTGTTGKSSGLLGEVLGKNQFDDRVDKDSDVGTAEAVSIIFRCIKMLGEVKGLFCAKFLFQLGLVFPGLLLPWLGKIVIDNVVLQRPIGGTEVVYPPFVTPVLTAIEGKDPLGIMLVLTTIYFVMMITIGSRTGGTGAYLLQGREAASQSEGTISAGSSSGGGLWGLAEFMVNVRMTQTIANNLRSRLFDRLTRMPMIVLDDQRIGDSVYRVLHDAPEAPDMAYLMTLAPFFALLGAAANLYILQYSFGEVSPELIWIAWAAIPMAFLTTFPFSGALRRTNQNKRAAGSATTNTIEESMSNVAAVQSLGARKQEQQRFASTSEESFLRERYATAVLIAIVGLATGVFGIAAIYVSIIISDRVIEGSMSPGDFAVLLGVYGGIAGSVSYFGILWIKLQDRIAAVRRVFFFLDYESEADRVGGVRLDRIAKGVAFRDVSFSYADGHQSLSHINLELKSGELVAFVGPTGAGKTTLAYLIPSLITPTSGRVLIDGHDVMDLDLASLREQITYVFQEHVLLSESIRENLLLANPEASEAELIEALTTAGCMEFIDGLADGIDTVLGRSGDTLSVGQQQRLSIARGLVRNSSVLILDEPTAALDPATENQLVASLRAASADRLVIVIAHRLSTIRTADRIVFLEQGQVKDVGSHDELMADSSSAYREFVELQGGANPA
ncbi:MAG: ABC transporter ATP-binding protein [Proteobacteria bacterium]|jgi:ABC-type multidrug transport system fused ATPase/permease subunit|nr:ABC transporter ATP-binding protein [Pseudomonadota bacterium]